MPTDVSRRVRGGQQWLFRCGACKRTADETADIALMADDLSKLPWLVRHSRRALAMIRQNIAFSLGVKAAFVILTFAGYSSMWGAIAADTGASLLVIFNGLRLLRTPVEVQTDSR